jgi:hypothetical protein
LRAASGTKARGSSEFKAAASGFHDLPETPPVFTRSGGEHVYFAYDGKPEIRNSEGKYGLGPGADIRGEGGWVVLPCPDSGYVWHSKFNFDTSRRCQFRLGLRTSSPSCRRRQPGRSGTAGSIRSGLCGIALMRSPAPRTANGAPIRELATAPIAPGNPSSVTIRDAVARKITRDLMTDDPDFDVERFLQDCEALS